MERDELDQLILHGTDDEVRETIRKLEGQVEALREERDEWQSRYGAALTRLDALRAGKGEEKPPMMRLDTATGKIEKVEEKPGPPPEGPKGLGEGEQCQNWDFVPLRGSMQCQGKIARDGDVLRCDFCRMVYKEGL